MKQQTTLLLSVFVFLITTLPAFANPRMVRRVNAVPNEYIVILNESTPKPAVLGIATSLAASYGGEFDDVWTESIKGFFLHAP